MIDNGEPLRIKRKGLKIQKKNKNLKNSKIIIKKQQNKK